MADDNIDTWSAEVEEAGARAIQTQPPLMVVSRRISDIPAEPIEWLWQGRIACGKLTMVAGHPGTGKSQNSAALAATVTRGGRWPVDGSRCPQGSVVFLSGEDDPSDTIRPRLEAAGADITKAYILEAVREYSGAQGPSERTFNLRADLPKLADLLEEIGDVRLIVIDPITAYLGKTDSHNNADVRGVLAPLADLASKHRAAVVGISHLNKAGGGNEALMRVMGSLAFVAAARAAFAVVKDQDDPERRLFLPLKNNIGNDTTGFSFRIEPVSLPGGIETSAIRWGDEAITVTADEAMTSNDPEEMSALDEAVEFLESILAAGAMAAKELKANAKDAGIAERTLIRAKKTLGIKPKKVGFMGDSKWVWELPVEMSFPDDSASKMAKSTEDGQTNNVDTFEDLGHLREIDAILAQAVFGTDMCVEDAREVFTKDDLEQIASGELSFDAVVHALNLYLGVSLPNSSSHGLRK